MYGIDRKTVRDIWNQKSWKKTTSPLWVCSSANKAERQNVEEKLDNDPFHFDWVPPSTPF